MATRKEDRVGQSKEKRDCNPCRKSRPALRLHHHWGLMQMGLLADHLLEVYGQEYDTSGKMGRRIDFVRTSWKIFINERKKDNTCYSIIEAYQLAGDRLGFEKTGWRSSGIERSLPLGDIER